MKKYDDTFFTILFADIFFQINVDILSFTFMFSSQSQRTQISLYSRDPVTQFEWEKNFLLLLFKPFLLPFAY